ncbi:MAG TPA: hypothetical protein VNO50_07000 [Pyrinomonadaceae bacterium]|nr:hypothetical protein [Pyrinomonadaceae bacterium]
MGTNMNKLSILLIALLITGCGAASMRIVSSPKLDVSVGGKDATLNLKSGATYLGNVISTAPGKPNVQTFAHTIYLANYDMDTSYPGWVRKPLAAPEHMRIDIQITGEEGTKDDSPFKVGTYSAKADKFNAVRSVIINSIVDGKETKTSFDTFSSSKVVEGELKITEVTAETVSGEVDLREGGNSIKGTFTANLPKKK